MTTPTDELTVDIDAADAKAVSEAAKKGANGHAPADPAELVVEKVEGAPEKVEKTALTPDEGLEKLRKDLENERAARIAADQRANEASRGEAAARGEAQTSQIDLVKGAIERLKESSDTLEGQYADAMALQDWKTAAKVQRQMSDNSAKLNYLETNKTRLEAAPKPVPRPPADPVENFASQLSPASAAWVRAHPEFARDSQKTELMIAAHQFALKKGLKADTPEYFASVEKTLDIAAPVVARADPVVDASADAAQAVGGRSTAPAAAPVSRSSNGANGNRPNVVRLTAQEVEMAEMMGMTAEDYARNKVALRKEGKLS